MKKSAYAIFFVLMISCDYFTVKQSIDKKGIVVAQIDDKKLYLSEIAAVFPVNISRKDSVELLKNYINTWARKHLMAAKAEVYLDKEQKNVSHELEDYRLSLLSYRYETQYVEQKIDTIVHEGEYETYYIQHAESFLINAPLAQVTYIKVKENESTIADIWRYARGSREDQLKKLDSLCIVAHVACDFFNNRWVDVDFLRRETIFTPEQCKRALSGNGCLEEKEGEYIYLLNFRAVKKIGDIAPLEHVKNNIYHTIISKRKQNMIKNLENVVYNEALDYKRLKIYVDE